VIALRGLWRSGLALLLVAALLTVAGPAYALNDAQELVVEAWRLVNQSYVDPGRFEAVHWRQLRQKALERPLGTSDEAYGAITAMLEPIGDPYTRLLRPADYSALRSSTRGSVSGVGLQLGMAGDPPRILVIAPLEGSPAAEAGILSGTEIVEVEGIPVRDLGLEATAARLRGPAGSSVQVRLQSSEGRTQDLVLERRQVDLRPVRSREVDSGGHRVGYLRISQFSESVPELVQRDLEALSGVEGLILDLRNNSGGLVEAGLAAANAFLDDQTIVETCGRNGFCDPLRATPGRLFDAPMLTLVNGGTASASEILAGALQGNGRSRLLGSRTFGKGLIQTLIGLGDGSGLAVTVARYLTPDGRDIQSQGIVPDVPLPDPEPLDPGGRGDTWLDAAVSELVNDLEAR
jgi:carboxyl-terminal processing protease